MSGEHVGESPQLRRDDDLESVRVQRHLDQLRAQGPGQQQTGSDHRSSEEGQHLLETSDERSAMAINQNFGFTFHKSPY